MFVVNADPVHAPLQQAAVIAGKLKHKHLQKESTFPLLLLTSAKNAHILRSEVVNLLAKGAMEAVPPAQSKSGFYSRYFLVPKKDGGLRPILDLRHLNCALMKRLFRMTTLKQILSQICPGDWFFSLDPKDTYFHIQIAPQSQT